MANMGGRQAADKEISNQSGGRTGAGTPKKSGPAVGKTSGNPTSSGGINRSTKKSSHQ